jgi:hypothetical protein
MESIVPKEKPAHQFANKVNPIEEGARSRYVPSEKPNFWPTPNFKGITMKNVRIALIALSFTAAAAGSTAALATDMAGKTRAQVHAELLQAQRDGTLNANAMTGATLRDLSPTLYPSKQAPSTVTRAQVLAELAEAQRLGTLNANAMTGATYRDLNPGNYPAKQDSGASLLGMGAGSTATQMN